MTKRHYHIILAIASSLLFASCQDTILSDDSPIANSTEETIAITGEEGIIALPAQLHTSSIEIKDAPFMTITKDGHLYCEQNDGNETRKGEIIVHTQEGGIHSLVYSQSPVSRSANSAMRQFYRHHGIGYSYNAVDGEYCNVSDFRCQVLNRAVIDEVQDKTLETLLTVDYGVKLETEAKVYSSVIDYVAEVNFEASASGNFLCISGTAAKNAAMFEEGTKDQYILHNKLSTINATYSLSYANVKSLAEKYPKLLTSSFRNALEKLGDGNDAKKLDDFIYTYGTHVVVFASLGASLTLDVQVDTHKFKNRQYEKSLCEASIASLFKSGSSTENFHETNETLKNSKCNIEVVGGDVSIFDPLIGLTKYDNTNVPSSLVEKWSSSINFDDDDHEKSNVELIDMKVIPICDLIPNQKLADRVQARITGNMSLIIDQLPNRNFVSTSFSAQPTGYSCRIGNEKKTINNPLTTDIIVANRHVATVCKEFVPEIDKNEKVFVAYPIYEGRIKMTNGLCLHNGKAYKVDYRYDNFEVTELKYGDSPISTNTIYMNAGVLSPVKSAGIDYQTAHYILGCERPGGIGIDGSLQGEALPVFKHFGHFYLANKTKYNNLPNWEYMTTAPAESKQYPTYFNGDEYKNRMVRSDNYVYILNPTEIGYY